MAKLSKKARHPEAPALAVEPAPRVAQRLEAADQRSRILERLTRVDKLGVGERRRSSLRCSKAARSTRAPASSGADTGELGRYHDFAQARIPAPPEPLPPRLAAPARRSQLKNSTRGEIFLPRNPL